MTDQSDHHDASSRVVYDGQAKTFGLAMEMQNGVLWYMGPYACLVDAVGSI